MILADMAVDGLMADEERAVEVKSSRDLFGAPVQAQESFDEGELGAAELRFLSRSGASA